MRHIDRLEKMEHTCVAFGRFDGVHLGHQAVIRALVEERKRSGRKAVVVSFPGTKEEKVLTTEMEKAYLLEKLGVDVLLSLQTGGKDQETLIQRVFIQKLGAEMFVAGSGCTERALLEQCGKELRLVDTVCAGGEPVTDVRAAEYLEAGDMEQLTKLCGHPYLMLGKVVHGKALGRTVGMPTANLKIYGTKHRPPGGVYATCTYLDGKAYYGVTNVGTRPSVDDLPEITIETMLADFDADIYGEKMMTEFHLYLRGIQKFDGIQAVWQQVQKDMEQAREYFECSMHDLCASRSVLLVTE